MQNIFQLFQECKCKSSIILSTIFEKLYRNNNFPFGQMYFLFGIYYKDFFFKDTRESRKQNKTGNVSLRDLGKSLAKIVT